MTTDTQALALSTNWLEVSDPTGGTTTTGGANVFTTYTYPDNWTYRWYYHPWPACTHNADDIILKMSEVERLRMVAREDKKLKKILEKFTPYIKVVVDFD